MIFLNSYLYNSSAFCNENANDLSRYRIILRSDTNSMYQILFKRLINDNGAKNALRGSLFPIKEQRDDLGLIPTDDEALLHILNTKIISGHNALLELDLSKSKKVSIFTDNNMLKIGACDSTIELMKKSEDKEKAYTTMVYLYQHMGYTENDIIEAMKKMSALMNSF